MAMNSASNSFRAGRSLLRGLSNLSSGMPRSQHETSCNSFLAQDFHTNEVQSERCGQLRGKTSYVHTRLGDTIAASVKEAQPRGKVMKGQVVYGVVVRSAMQKGRGDGSEVKFDVNAVVLVNKQGEPIGTRVFGPVPHELRKKKYVKILGLAQHIA